MVIYNANNMDPDQTAPETALEQSDQVPYFTMGGSRGGTGGPDPPLNNHKNIGFPSNTGPCS